MLRMQLGRRRFPKKIHSFTDNAMSCGRRHVMLITIINLSYVQGRHLVQDTYLNRMWNWLEGWVFKNTLILWIIHRAHGWATDLYLLENKWCNKIFMAHGYKMLNLQPTNNTKDDVETALMVCDINSINIYSNCSVYQVAMNVNQTVLHGHIDPIDWSLVQNCASALKRSNDGFNKVMQHRQLKQHSY
jgi:hypothetical protein